MGQSVTTTAKPQFDLFGFGAFASPLFDTWMEVLGHISPADANGFDEIAWDAIYSEAKLKDTGYGATMPTIPLIVQETLLHTLKGALACCLDEVLRSFGFVPPIDNLLEQIDYYADGDKPYIRIGSYTIESLDNALDGLGNIVTGYFDEANRLDEIENIDWRSFGWLG